MQIKDLFLKPIDRPINGVIKADQRDAASIWQELDEYVVTKQLTEHFRKFFDAYNQASGERMGVWVSGFFGSGKSHFIKILSYLLENIEAVSPANGEVKKASAFFDAHKIKDAMLLADVQRAVSGSADVILFNIDSKADSKSDRDVILQVFLRVFNEKLGLSGDAPHIADMERHLIAKGVYQEFIDTFQAKHGSSWIKERDAVDFLRDDVVYALSKALSMTMESAEKWFDNARDDYRINIESLAKIIRDYLATKSADHRIVFLVDEVGQFIGDNTQLMLTLQTIIEELGLKCNGRAWVIVTSQEDIDAAIGGANKAKTQDFSKIQGRFYTRLSLASSNTDEVIGERLLSKTPQAKKTLEDTFTKNGDIINNQLVFVGNSATMRGYRDSLEFAACYPFAPYQFQLLQKIFESIRKVGATGQHLSRGERSLLDAFQSAALKNADKNTDALIPIYDFYPSIESFIDTTAKRSIDDAPSNDALEPYDVNLLKALFLIRYIGDVLKPNVDNIATLCVSQIDQDKINLRRTIQESLTRLENQKLVSRNGDLWYFLTNEERDVAREIGHVTVAAAEKMRLLAELMFDEVLDNQTKIRHRDTKGDYEFNRLLDGSPYKNANHELILEIISPLNDDYERLNDSQCILKSTEGHGRALIRLAEGERFDIELMLYLQIEKYIDSPKASSANASMRTILSNRKEENRERKARLKEQLSQSLVAGEIYALGQKPSFKSTAPSSLLDDLINYLISNTYTKLAYLKHKVADPVAEIRAVLSADDVTQKGLGLNGEEGNAQAITEMRDYLNLQASTQRVLLSDVVERFTNMPWGWKPESEIVLLVARLFMAGEIKLTFEGSDIDPKSAIDPLTKSVKYRQVSILKRKTSDANAILKVKDLYKQLFSKLARDDEDGLVADFKLQLKGWQSTLESILPIASTKHHPGKSLIDGLLVKIKRQLAIRDTFEFIEAVISAKDDLLDCSDHVHDVTHFYQRQINTWRRMLESMSEFADNHDALLKDAQAASALSELAAIRDNTAPYGHVNRIDALIGTVATVNNRIASGERESALFTIDQCIAEVQKALATSEANASLSNQVLQPLQQVKAAVTSLSSIPKIRYLKEQAGTHLDNAIDTIAHVFKPIALVVSEPGGTATVLTTGTSKPATPVKPAKVIRAADIATKVYLETEADVDDYLARLKNKIVSEINAGAKVRVQ